MNGITTKNNLPRVSVSACLKTAADEVFPHQWDYSIERVEKMTITPIEAQWILENKNNHNRTLPRASLNFIIPALKEGRWVINGETIKFRWNGELDDGQTRLTACVMTGIPITTYVAFGLPDGTFETTDRGTRRKVSDDLGAQGEKNTAMLAAVLSLLKQEEEGRLQEISAGRRTFLTPVLLDVLGRHPNVRSYTGNSKQYSKRYILQPRLATFCVYRFETTDQETARQFFDSLETGIGFSAGDPVCLLRNRLMDDLRSKAKLPDHEKLALTIKAWNYKRRGEKIKYLKWTSDGKTPEPYPTIE